MFVNFGEDSVQPFGEGTESDQNSSLKSSSKHLNTG